MATNILSDEINKLRSVNLEEQSLSRFARLNGSSQQIQTFLTIIQSNGQMFTDQEKREIIDSVNRYSPSAAQMINRNLLFISTQTQDPMTKFKIQYLRQYLQIENEEVNIAFTGKESVEELENLYRQFEKAVPKRFEFLVVQYPARDGRENMLQNLKKLEKWFPTQNNDLVFLFLLSFFKKESTEYSASLHKVVDILENIPPEVLVNHFEAYVLREIEAGRLELDPETKALKGFETPYDVLKLFHGFMKAYREKQTTSPAQELALARTQKTSAFAVAQLRDPNKPAGDQARPAKTVGFREEIKELHYPREGSPTEMAPLNRDAVITREHKTETREFRKDSKNKSVEVAENPFLRQIENQKYYLKKLAQHMEPTWKLDKLMHPSVYDRSGKLIEVDLRETAPEEAAFYEQFLNEIDRETAGASHDSEEYQKAAWAIVQGRLKATDRLAHPSTFYGKPVQEPRFSSYNRAYPIALDSSMRKDEARLHQKYNELLKTQGPDERTLSDENLARMHEWIDWEGAASYEILQKSHMDTEEFLQKYEPLIASLHAIQSVPGSRPGDTAMAKKDPNRFGERYEKIKGVVKYPFQELDRREAALVKQSESPAILEELKHLRREREILTRIVELFCSDKMYTANMRSLDSTEECLGMLRQILLGNEEIQVNDPSQITDKESLLHIDLPLYFPERLKDYLNAFHSARVSEANASLKGKEEATL